MIFISLFQIPLSAPLQAATFSWIGGTGDWDTSALNWEGAPWDNAKLDVAAFAGTAGTVTLTTPITAGGLIFSTGGYSLTGSSLTLGLPGANRLQTDTGTTTISSILAGGSLNRLVKTGAGTLTLSGANTFTGGLVVSAGTLQWSVNGALGASGTVFLNDANTGTANVSLFGTTAASAMARNITVLNQGSGTVTLGGNQTSGRVDYTGVVTLNRAVTLRGPAGTDRTDFSGNITGNVGTLTLIGGGRIIFTGATKTFNGNLALSGSGTNLQIGVASTTAQDQIPNASSVTVGTGAVLRLSALNEEFGGLNGTGTVNSNAAPAGGVFTIGSHNAAGSFTGTIGLNGTGMGITKMGSGMQVFSGSNTYTGITTVNRGVLRGTQTSGTPFGVGSVVLNGGVLSLAPTGSASVSLTGASTAVTSTLTYGGGAMIQLNRGTNTSLTYTVGNAAPTVPVLSRSGRGTLALEYSSDAALGTSERFIVRGLTSAANVNGIYDSSVVAVTGSSGTFLKYVDAPTGFAPAESGASSYTARSGSLAADTLVSTEVTDIADGTQFAGNNTVYAVRLTGAVGFSTGSTVFTVNGTTGTAGLILNAATLGTTSTRGVLALGASEGLLFTAGSSTMHSVITGSAGLTTFGPGSLTLTGNNTFTGGLHINQGSVNISDANQLGSGSVTLNGGMLVSTATTSTVVGQSFVMGLAGGFISPAASTTLTINTGVTGTAGSLVKSGAGTLALRTTTLNTLPTFIDVNEGVLQVAGGSFAVDKMQGNGVITVRSGATLSIIDNHGLGGNNAAMTESVILAGGTMNLNAFDQYFNNLSLQGAQVNLATGASMRPSSASNFLVNGTAPSTISGTGSGEFDISFGTLNLNVMDVEGTSATDLTLALPVVGTSSTFAFNLNGTGTGTVAVNGANTYVGPTNISSGTFKMGHVSALGGVASLPTAGTNQTQVSGNGVLDLNGLTNINESIRLSGTGILGEGALVNSSATPASIGSGIAGIAQTTGGTGANPTLSVSGGGGSGAVVTASMGLTSGSFSINGGTTVYSVAPTVTITGGGGTTGATATAILTDGVVTGITITGSGLGYTGTPNISFSAGTITTPGTNPTGTGNASNFTLVNYNITNPGSGYTSVPTLNYGAGPWVATPILAGIVLTGDASIGGTGDIAIQGIISETGGPRTLLKVGSNTLVLNNRNTYTGDTIISQGTLQIGSAGQTGTGIVTVQNGGTILGTGRIQGSAFFLQSGAHLRPGNSVADSSLGTLTLAPAAGPGSFSLEMGSTIHLGLSTGGLSDLLSFDGISNGALEFNGNLTLMAPGYMPTSVETFNLLDWSNLTANFASRYNASSYSDHLLGNGDDNQGFDLPDISGSGYAWDISAFITSGVISTTLIVPEPSRALLVCLGLVGLMLQRSRCKALAA